MEYVPSDRKGLFPVGRLDKDTEGLLLITDDGMLAHELLAPGKHVDKTYFVRVEGKLTVENIRETGEWCGYRRRETDHACESVEIVGGSWEGAGDIATRSCAHRKSAGSVYRIASDNSRRQVSSGQEDDGSSRKPSHLPQENLHGSAYPPRQSQER